MQGTLLARLCPGPGQIERAGVEQRRTASDRLGGNPSKGFGLSRVSSPSSVEGPGEFRISVGRHLTRRASFGCSVTGALCSPPAPVDWERGLGYAWDRRDGGRLEQADCLVSRSLRDVQVLRREAAGSRLRFQ